jgi:hypothetical protein
MKPLLRRMDFMCIFENVHFFILVLHTEYNQDFMSFDLTSVNMKTGLLQVVTDFLKMFINVLEKHADSLFRINY